MLGAFVKGRPAEKLAPGFEKDFAGSHYRTDQTSGRAIRQPANSRNLEDWAMSKSRNVKDLMNPDIMTVADEMTTDELARYLIEREISGAPVVDSQGHLIGVVSMTDIGRNMADRSEFTSSRSSGFYRDYASDLTLDDVGQRYVEERAVTVRDVMTPAIHQVPVTASVADVARIMVEQHIHRLVVTHGKEPVGIITSMDLLKMVADQS
jgi:predicted transcriptional regulator